MISSYRNDESLVLIGLSTDSKPTAVANGTLFYEMDTELVFIRDEENGTWRQA